MRKPVLIELQYLPPLSYFNLVVSTEALWLEKQEHYIKQSYRNRCYIQNSQGVEALIIPIRHQKNTPIDKTAVDNTQNWKTKHWRSIETSYRKAPYFEYFANYFLPIYTRKDTLLWQFNEDLLTICLKLMPYKIPINHTSLFEKEADPSFFDARNLIIPKNTKALEEVYRPFVYKQNFGSDFAPNLSIIDLLFCQGTHSLQILRNSSLK